MNALPINIFLYLYIGGVPHHRGVYWHIAWPQTIPLGPQPICYFCSTYLGGVQPRNPKYHLVLNRDACFPCTYALQIQRYTLGLRATRYGIAKRIKRIISIIRILSSKVTIILDRKTMMPRDCVGFCMWVRTAQEYFVRPCFNSRLKPQHVFLNPLQDIGNIRIVMCIPRSEPNQAKQMIQIQKNSPMLQMHFLAYLVSCAVSCMRCSHAPLFPRKGGTSFDLLANLLVLTMYSCIHQVQGYLLHTEQIQCLDQVLCGTCKTSE